MTAKVEAILGRPMTPFEREILRRFLAKLEEANDG